MFKNIIIEKKLQKINRLGKVRLESDRTAASVWQVKLKNKGGVFFQSWSLMDPQMRKGWDREIRFSDEL